MIKIDVYNYSSNDYTGDWAKLSMKLNGDTLIYNSAKGINFHDTTYYFHKEFLYNLKLKINNNDVLTECYLKDIESGSERDTIFTKTLIEDNFDFTYGGGAKYDLKIDFGPNTFYIKGIESSQSNILYANKDEITNDSLILKNYHQDFQPSTYYADYNYFFRKVSN